MVGSTFALEVGIHWLIALGNKGFISEEPNSNHMLQDEVS
jgi:hypothetical protein